MIYVLIHFFFRLQPKAKWQLSVRIYWFQLWYSNKLFLKQNCKISWKHKSLLCYNAKCNSFSSPEQWAQMSFSDRMSSVVYMLTFHIFNFFSRITGSILTILGTKHPLLKGSSSLYKWSATLFPKEEIILK